MTTFNFKTITLGLALLLLVSVAHGKCYPGLDCPEDLPNADKAVPEPSTRQQEPESKREPTPEPIADESQPTEKIVGHKMPTESNDTPEEAPALTKYGNFPKSISKYKYSK